MKNTRDKKGSKIGLDLRVIEKTTIYINLHAETPYILDNSKYTCIEIIHF